MKEKAEVRSSRKGVIPPPKTFLPAPGMSSPRKEAADKPRKEIEEIDSPKDQSGEKLSFGLAEPSERTIEEMEQTVIVAETSAEDSTEKITELKRNAMTMEDLLSAKTEMQQEIQAKKIRNPKRSRTTNRRNAGPNQQNLRVSPHKKGLSQRLYRQRYTSDGCADVSTDPGKSYVELST